MKRRHGITMVKLLIVVTILGVLGAIVVPQFSSATGDAQVSLQCTNLQAFGKQIEPCEHHHDEALPTTGQIQPDDNHDADGDSTPDHVDL